MLVIRQQQIDALIRNSDLEWREFLAATVKERNASIAGQVTDEQLAGMIDAALTKSEQYGFTSAPQQAAFTAVMFEVGPNFDEQPEIKAVLEEALPADIRLERLWSVLVPDEAWEKAAEAGGAAAWPEEASSETPSQQKSERAEPVKDAAMSAAAAAYAAAQARAAAPAPDSPAEE